MSNLSPNVRNRIYQAFGTSSEEQGWADELLAAIDASVKSNDQWAATQAAATTAAALTAAGVSAATVLAHATDVAGNIQLTSGGSALSAGALTTVTFSTPYSVAPIITLTAANAAAAAAGAYVTATTTGFTINSGSALTASTPYLWNWFSVRTQ